MTMSSLTEVKGGLRESTDGAEQGAGHTPKSSTRRQYIIPVTTIPIPILAFLLFGSGFY